MKTRLTAYYSKMPIGTKIAFIYSCVFMLMIIILSILALLNMCMAYSNVSKKELNDAADRIESYIIEGKSLDRKSLREVIDNPYIDVKIFKRGGAPENNFGTMKRPEDFPMPDNKMGPYGKDSYGKNSVDNDWYMSMHRVFQVDNEIYDIMIFRKYNNEYKVINICVAVIIVTNIISILVAVLVGKYICRKMLAPVMDVTETAENISLYDLSQRIAIPEADDEIRNLVITFNDMIERLQESFNKENRFISDASHELKTPIAIIQGYINMMDRWGKDDPDILNESIESIKSETEHINKLIQQLLYLARDLQGNNEISFEDILLNDTAEEVKKEIEIADPDIETEFVNKCGEDIRLNTDVHLLKQLIWIFADNGIKYSGDKKCKIVIKTGYKDGNPYVSVTDNGIGIPEEDIDKIFDRFYRYDKSRNKAIEGNGLGLSIAASIAKQLKARIEVNSKVGEGSTFSVIFDKAKRL